MPKSRLTTCVTVPTPTDAAGHEYIADFDFIGALDVFDAAQVFRFIASSADKPASSRSLHDDIDTTSGIDDEAHIDGVTRNFQRRSDDAVGRDDRQVQTDVAGISIERDACDPEKLVRVFADHLGADDIHTNAGAQVQKPFEPTIFFFEFFEFAHALAKTCVLRSEARVVFFHVDQVDVIAPKVGHTASCRGSEILHRCGKTNDDLVGPGDLSRVTHARAKKPKRHREGEQNNGKIAVTLQVHGVCESSGEIRLCRDQQLASDVDKKRSFGPIGCHDITTSATSRSVRRSNQVGASCSRLEIFEFFGTFIQTNDRQPMVTSLSSSR